MAIFIIKKIYDLLVSSFSSHFSVAIWAYLSATWHSLLMGNFVSAAWANAHIEAGAKFPRIAGCAIDIEAANLCTTTKRTG